MLFCIRFFLLIVNYISLLIYKKIKIKIFFKKKVSEANIIKQVVMIVIICVDVSSDLVPL